MRIYWDIVLEGQTLYGLAKQYRLTVERLVEDNPGTENGIRIGQQLKIYAGQAEVVQKHVVSKGESLYKISKMYGVTVAQLTAWNPGLTENHVVLPEMGFKIIGLRVAVKLFHIVHPFAEETVQVCI